MGTDRHRPPRRCRAGLLPNDKVMMPVSAPSPAPSPRAESLQAQGPTRPLSGLPGRGGLMLSGWGPAPGSRQPSGSPPQGKGTQHAGVGRGLESCPAPPFQGRHADQAPRVYGAKGTSVTLLSRERATGQQRAECPAPCEPPQPMGRRPVAEMVVFLASLAAAPL